MIGSFCGTKTQLQDVQKGRREERWSYQEEGSRCLQSDAITGESDRSQDKRNGQGKKDAVQPCIKKAEEAKKSKKPKIFQKHLEFIIRMLCNPWWTLDLSCDGDGNEHLYRTLCVLVCLKNSLLDMFIPFGKDFLQSITLTTSVLFYLKISLLDMFIPFGKDFLQSITLTTSVHFPLKISLLEMLSAFGNEHLKSPPKVSVDARGRINL